MAVMDSQNDFTPSVQGSPAQGPHEFGRDSAESSRAWLLARHRTGKCDESKRGALQINKQHTGTESSSAPATAASTVLGSQSSSCAAPATL